MPRLLIKTSASPPAPVGLVVTMNDQDVTALLGVDNPVDLGDYKIVARAPGHRDQHAAVEIVAEGKTATVTLELERAPVVAPRPRVADEPIREQPIARAVDPSTTRRPRRRHAGGPTR